MFTRLSDLPQTGSYNSTSGLLEVRAVVQPLFSECSPVVV